MFNVDFCSRQSRENPFRWPNVFDILFVCKIDKCENNNYFRQLYGLMPKQFLFWQISLNDEHFLNLAFFEEDLTAVFLPNSHTCIFFVKKKYSRNYLQCKIKMLLLGNRNNKSSNFDIYFGDVDLIARYWTIKQSRLPEHRQHKQRMLLPIGKLIKLT